MNRISLLTVLLLTSVSASEIDINECLDIETPQATHLSDTACYSSSGEFTVENTHANTPETTPVSQTVAANDEVTVSPSLNRTVSKACLKGKKRNAVMGN